MNFSEAGERLVWFWLTTARPRQDFVSNVIYKFIDSFSCEGSLLKRVSEEFISGQMSVLFGEKRGVPGDRINLASAFI